MSCNKATGIQATALDGQTLPNGTRGCALTVFWNPTGGQAIQLIINNIPYVDPSTGFVYWSAAVNGVGCAWYQLQNQGISNGIQTGMVYNIKVRTFCDLNNLSNFLDSDPIVFTVTEPGLNCTGATPPVAPVTSGKKKGK